MTTSEIPCPACGRAESINWERDTVFSSPWRCRCGALSYLDEERRCFILMTTPEMTAVRSALALERIATALEELSMCVVTGYSGSEAFNVVKDDR